MKLAILLTASILASAKAPESTTPGTTFPLTICMDPISNPYAAAAARAHAAAMFAGLGVSITWSQRLETCEAGSIRIAVSEDTPKDIHPGAMAYAMPEVGPGASAHIRIFYDRIAEKGDQIAPCVLAHVLIHELTHVLQGVSRHSSGGVMKARWTHNDYTAMLSRQLSLTNEDVRLIRLGLADRRTDPDPVRP